MENNEIELEEGELTEEDLDGTTGGKGIHKKPPQKHPNPVAPPSSLVPGGSLLGNINPGGSLISNTGAGVISPDSATFRGNRGS